MPNEQGHTRYGHRAGSGANEPKRNEKKEHAPDWQPRQGAQTREGPLDRGLGQTRPNEPLERDATGKDADGRDPRSMGKATRGQDEVATRRHLEGSEQGPA